jgi:hypothetical protein
MPGRYSVKSPSRGGKRKGSGPPLGPKSAASKHAKALVEGSLAKGLDLPLDVMLKTMRKVLAEQGEVKAFPFAEACAPYLHPKRQPVDDKGSSQITVSRVYFGGDPATDTESVAAAAVSTAGVALP